MNRALLFQRNPLVRVDEVVVSVIEQIVLLAENHCSAFSRYGLDVEAVAVCEVVLDVVDDFEDLLSEFDTLFRVAVISEFVDLDESELLDGLVQTEDADCAVLCCTDE